MTSSPLKTAGDAFRRPFVIAQRGDGSLVAAGFIQRPLEAPHE
ncbi:MAG: hypothetical protein AB9880_04210 [Christensenellales bacterium]